MKSIQITSLTLVTAFGLLACNSTSSLTPKPSVADIRGTAFYTVNDRGLPTLQNLGRTAADAPSRELVIGYQDRASLDRVANHFGAIIEEDLTQIRGALLVLPENLSPIKAAFALQLNTSSAGLRYATANRFEDKRGDVPNYQNDLNAASMRTLAATDPLVVKQWWLKQIKADKVRDIATGKGVIVGVVDDDFSRLHEDLKADGKIVTGIDTSTGNLLTPDMPLTSGDHGSGSAGTIAQRTNGIGGEGVAPDAILMPIRIFTARGFTGDLNVAKGIIWAVDNGVQVLNNSWGGGGYSLLIKEAVDYALARGVVVVGSAGNDRRDLHNGPEAYTGVISVGASAGDDVKADFSNFGDRTDLFAPGDAGLTTYIRAGKPLNSYGLFGGTSMAGPVVAGGAALLLERAKALNVTLSPYQIKKILASTGDSMNDPRTIGLNRINLEKALQFTAKSIPADAGNVLVQVTDLVEGVRIATTDVILTPLEGQNKKLDYLGKTANGTFDAPTATPEQQTRGVAAFYGVEPGLYEVKVAGSSWITFAGTRTALLGKVRVESGKTTRLQYQHQFDFYEFTGQGVRNGSPQSAFDLTQVPSTVFADSLLFGGTFDNNYSVPSFPEADPTTSDTDVFAMVIPAGTTLTATVFSSKLGALGLGKVSIVAQDGTLLQQGVAAPAISPADQIASLKNETAEPITVYVIYGEQSGAGGLDYWYAHTLQIK